MSFSGTLFLMAYYLISWCGRKKLQTELRLLLLKVVLFLYLVPFPVFKYVFPEPLYKVGSADFVDTYHFVENYLIHNQQDFIADKAYIYTWIWCIGCGTVAAIFSVLYLIKYLRAKKALAGCSVKIANPGHIEKVETLKKELGLEKHMNFVFSDYFSSPFTFGYLSPTIVLPASMENFSGEKWDFAIRHELNHIKSHHMGIKLIALIVNLIHFFNPFAYLLRYEISNMCEIDCDCKTIKNYDTETRQKYSEYIIDTASNSKELCVIGSIGLIGNRFKKKIITRRVLEMNETKKKKRAVSVIAALTAIFIGSASVFAYEPAVEMEVDFELNPEHDYGCCNDIQDYAGYYIAIDLSEDDTFIDKDGNVYNFSDANRAICFHSYVDAVVWDHSLNSDGSCATVFYDAQRCTKCGNTKNKVYKSEMTYKVCPH